MSPGRKNRAEGRAALRPRLLAASVAACFAVSIPAARANPTGPSVVSGSAQFATSGSTLAITNSANAVINWQSFSIGVNEITRFLQPSAASAVLNRVTGTNGVIPQSVIDGLLQSNGHVYLLNRSGIVFGNTARIDVAGLVASSLDLSDDDFLNKRNRFFAAQGAAAVVNHGVIETAAGGKVYLVAPDVQNTGIIRAPQGEIILAAGKSAELISESSPYVTVKVEADTEKALNVGSLIADAGRIGMFGALVRHSGVADASAAVVGDGGQIRFVATKDLTLDAGSRVAANGANGGNVSLQAQTGVNAISGTVEATGSSGKGGQVSALGVRVGVLGQGIIDASGETGGGTVLVGGDYQGKNPDVQNAQRTVVGKDGVIRADARTTGDGGRVIVWADGDTFMAGSISARGGSQSGNGGFVETSGKQNLSFTGKVDASAPNGNTGTLLLDPEDIRIADLPDGSGDDGLVRDGIILLGDLLGQPVTITAEALQNLANDVNIDLAANRSITMDPLTRTGNALTLDQIGFVRMTTNTGPIDLGTGNTINLTGTGSLVLTAGTDIKTGPINTTGGSVLFTAGSSSPITVLGDILTRGGEIRLTGGDISVGKVHTTGGSGQAETSVTLLGNGNVTTGDILTGPAPTNSSVTVDAKLGSITAGNITTGDAADGAPPNRGSSVLLTAASTVTAGDITTGNALDNSWVRVQGAAGVSVGNIVTGLASVLSNIELSSGGPLKTRNLTIRGGAGDGSVFAQSSGGGVMIGDDDGAGGVIAGTGDVKTEGGHFIASGTGIAVGNILTSGGESGAGVVSMSSSTGDIVTGSITTASLKDGFAGGQVDIRADSGDISIRGDINTSGALGYGNGSVFGSNGGDVRLWRMDPQATGSITVQGSIITRGGDGVTGFSGDGGSGGQGGNVEIGGVVDICQDGCFVAAAMPGTIAINGPIDTRGGVGAKGVDGVTTQGGAGGAGGSGGSIRILAVDGLSIAGTITADGGAAGDGGAYGGNGGSNSFNSGGDIELQGLALNLGGAISSSGGKGGNGGSNAIALSGTDFLEAGRGGEGGDGGFISITGGAFTAPAISANGGTGGIGGSNNSVSVSGTTNAEAEVGLGGRGGEGGFVQISATTSDLVAGSIAAKGGDGGAGGSGNAANVSSSGLDSSTFASATVGGGGSGGSGGGVDVDGAGKVSLGAVTLDGGAGGAGGGNAGASVNATAIAGAGYGTFANAFAFAAAGGSGGGGGQLGATAALDFSAGPISLRSGAGGAGGATASASASASADTGSAFAQLARGGDGLNGGSLFVDASTATINGGIFAEGGLGGAAGTVAAGSGGDGGRGGDGGNVGLTARSVDAGGKSVLVTGDVHAHGGNGGDGSAASSGSFTGGTGGDGGTAGLVSIDGAGAVGVTGMIRVSAGNGGQGGAYGGAGGIGGNAVRPALVDGQLVDGAVRTQAALVYGTPFSGVAITAGSTVDIGGAAASGGAGGTGGAGLGVSAGGAGGGGGVGGTIVINAGNDITVTGDLVASGGSGGAGGDGSSAALAGGSGGSGGFSGNVGLTSSTGAIAVGGTIKVNGGGGGDGGAFGGSGGSGGGRFGTGQETFVAGFIDVSAAGSVSIGGAAASGGAGGSAGASNNDLAGLSGDGGAGGVVLLQGSGVTVGAYGILASGGDGGAGGDGGSGGSGSFGATAGGAGAAGGNVSVQAGATGNITIAGAIDINGGSGGNGGSQANGNFAGAGGAGAAGGTVGISGAVVSIGAIGANAGSGGAAGAGSQNTSTAGGGNGAAGGMVSLAGASLTTGDISANGGSGGNVDSNGTAGSGAAGGIIATSGPGSVGNVSANGGAAGTVLGAGSTSGAGGAGGTIVIDTNATGFLSALGTGAGDGTITLTSSGDLSIGGATAALMGISAAGAVTQTGVITSSILDVSGTSVTLDLANNVSVLGGQATGGDFVFDATGSLLLTGVAATNLASISAGAAILSAAPAYTVEGNSVLLGAGGALGSPVGFLNVRAASFAATAAGGISVNLNSFTPQFATINTLMNSGSGDIALNAFGGAQINSMVSNPGGSVFISTFSPLVIQSGVSAGGDIGLSTGGSAEGSAGANDMILRGTYTYSATGTFTVTVGAGGTLTVPDQGTELILRTELFPNEPQITSFTFLGMSPLSNPEVLQAVGTTLLETVETAVGAEKEEEGNTKQRRSLGTCRPA